MTRIPESVSGILLSSNGAVVGSVRTPSHVHPEFISLRGRVYKRDYGSHFDNEKQMAEHPSADPQGLTFAWREVWVWEVEP